MTTTLESYLAEHPMFRDLDPDYVKLLGECATDVSFDAGETLFRYGESADRFYLIRDGRVSLEATSTSGEALTIQTLEAGEVLGWSWLFPPYIWYFDARAMTRTRALAFDGLYLRAKCDEDPKLGYELMKRFSAILNSRLQAARLQILDIYGPTAT
ncbi:MAG: cyclic nucleotide-binding domain-containing protein [Betaproteobacteria bacterium]|nr:MAG: cyclic nucleotide-binding domain-containing protein [Betaproteobacteria bacterium]